MLQRDPRNVARYVRFRVASWWRRGPSRLRLRRRLVVYSIPITLMLLAVIGKIVSTMLTGNAAVSDFAHHDIDALRGDVSTLRTMNIIEPGQVSFIAGDLAVLEGKLDDAERQFTEALARTPGGNSCPVRVNLELVRETQGDLAARDGDKARAEERFNSALQVISGAPAGCFKNNTDTNPDRRRIRNDAAARLADKIKALHLPPAPPAAAPAPGPPPPGATSSPTPPPPPPPAPGGNGPVVGPEGGGGDGPGVINDVGPDRIPVWGSGSAQHRLGTGGDPLDTLQRALGDADATGGSSEDSNAHT